jgi:hypothetical protein
MSVQIVMDHTGDTRHQFDPADTAAVALAEQRFRELTGLGFTPYVKVAPNEQGHTARLVRTFDPTAEETLFRPGLQGG